MVIFAIAWLVVCDSNGCEQHRRCTWRCWCWWTASSCFAWLTFSYVWASCVHFLFMYIHAPCKLLSPQLI